MPLLLPLAAFAISTFVTILAIRFQDTHANFSHDHDTNSPQKFHTNPVPRVGGISVFLAIVSVAFWMLPPDSDTEFLAKTILWSCLPVFLSGLLEDISKKVSPKIRLIAAFLSAAAFGYCLNIQISSINIQWFDLLLHNHIFNIIFVCIMIAGLTNSYNIIDGFNGLASMTAMTSMLAIILVSYQLNDFAVFNLATIFLAAILGFFIFNYPKGSIFLGDGGAYLAGFLVSALSILLIARNPGDVSSWFACAINIYPAFETIFSIWRKAVLKRMNPGAPDGSHLHMLIYKRITNTKEVMGKKFNINPNARTSHYFWVLNLITTLPAVFFYNTPYILQLLTISFCLFYIYIYKRLIRFNTPKWLL